MQQDLLKMEQIYLNLDSYFMNKVHIMMHVYLVKKSQENISSILILIMELLVQLLRRLQGLDSTFIKETI